ncbi:MAG: Nramp family divalent metal transporter [Candidatus Lokiarchaeota archaeon]
MNSNISSQKTTQIPRISKPPLTIKTFIKYLGPAFIFTATQIGGGEFITVPLLGAYAGMAGLFLVPLIAFAKIFGQYYLVQYGVVRGKTFLQTCWDKKWLRWMFFLLMLGCILHSILLAGLLGQTGYTFNVLAPISKDFWIIILIIVAFLIVVTKSYNLLEKISSVLLWIFLTLITIVAILFWPTLEQWATAFIPQLPGAIEGLATTSGPMTLAVLFVVLGAGFGPTVSYIWYAKDRKMGMFEATAKGYELEPEDLTTEEQNRLKGWKKVILYQNVISATILTLFSSFIWIAAAQTLYPMGIKPQKDKLIIEMVTIFTSTYGQWSGLIFIICGMTALFSSIIGPFYGFSRLWEESFEKLGLYNKVKIKKITVFRLVLLMFAILPVVFIFLVQRPMWLFSLYSEI